MRRGFHSITLYISEADCLVCFSSTLRTSKVRELLPKETVTVSPGLTSLAGFAGLPLISMRPPEQASAATVRRFMTRETLRNLSILIFSPVVSPPFSWRGARRGRAAGCLACAAPAYPRSRAGRSVSERAEKNCVFLKIAPSDHLTDLQNADTIGKCAIMLIPALEIPYFGGRGLYLTALV